MVIGGFKDATLTECTQDVEIFSLVDPHFKLILQPLPKCMKNLVGGIVNHPDYENDQIPLVCDTEITPNPCFLFIEGSWIESEITLNSGFKSNSFAQYNETSIWVIGSNESYLINTEKNQFHGGFFYVSPGHNCLANLDRKPWVIGVQGNGPQFHKSTTTSNENRCNLDAGVTYPTWCEVAYANNSSDK